jgi:hypothetical protein
MVLFGDNTFQDMQRHVPFQALTPQKLSTDSGTSSIHLTSNHPEIPPVDYDLYVTPPPPSPPCIVYTVDPDTISPGDSALITLREKKPDGTIVDFAPDQSFYIAITGGGEAGTLVAEPDTGQELWGYQPFKFIAYQTLVPDSVTVHIYASLGGGASAMGIRGEPGKTFGKEFLHGKVAGKKSGIRPRHPYELPDNGAQRVPVPTRGAAAKVGRPGISSVPAERASRQVVTSAAAMGEAECPPETTLVVKKRTILLGETKYYQARIDLHQADKLVIEERSEPTLNPNSITNEDPWGDSPLVTVSGGKLGVYWDKNRADIRTGELEPVMRGLSTGLIRLIGRYWDRDSSYKVRLSASTPGRTGEIVIEVKRPDYLGTAHPTVTGPTEAGGTDNTWSLDSLIIEHAGREGIMPQIIKGVVEKESMDFHPSYRYEPFADLTGVQEPDGGFPSTHRYWIQSPTSLGNPGIPVHDNVRDAASRVIQYPGYITAWEYYTNNQGFYSRTIYTKLQDKWEGFYRDQIASFRERGIDSTTAAPQARAQAETSYVNWLRDEIGGTGMVGTVAQTRIAASYGLMQLTYFGGVRAFYEEVERRSGRPAAVLDEWRRYRYPDDNAAYLPEFINIPPIGLKYGVLHLRGKIRQGLGTMDNFVSETWRQGLEVGYWRGLKKYNGSMTYPNPVFGFADHYLPRKGH